MRRDLSRRMLQLTLAVLLTLTALTGAAWAQDAEPAAAAPATDPSDQIVVHIEELTRLVKDNRDDPEKVKTELKAYLGTHGDAMKLAGEAFEAHLKTLAADEAEAYKEKLQRKMEKALASFLETMLDFAERHPDAAKELDELLQKFD